MMKWLSTNSNKTIIILKIWQIIWPSEILVSYIYRYTYIKTSLNRHFWIVDKFKWPIAFSIKRFHYGNKKSNSCYLKNQGNCFAVYVNVCVLTVLSISNSYWLSVMDIICIGHVKFDFKDMSLYMM